MKLQLNNLKVNQKRKDINFFSLQKQKKSVATAGILLVIIPIVLVAGMFSVYSYNKQQIDMLNQQYEQEAKKLAAINLKEKQPILKRAQVKRDIFATYYSWITSLNSQLEDYKIVPSQLLEDMTKAAGTKVECIAISARNNTMTFEGVAPTYSDIANYQRACSQIEGVKDVFVSTIEKQDDVKSIITKPTLRTAAQRKAIVVGEEYAFVMTVNFGEKPEKVEEAEDANNTKTETAKAAESSKK